MCVPCLPCCSGTGRASDEFASLISQCATAPFPGAKRVRPLLALLQRQWQSQ